MPQPMVHLAVAKEVSTMVGEHIQDLSQYYMGILAPDAINLRANKTDQDRILSHICRVKYPPHDLWCQDILAYFENLCDAPSADFCTGYRVHLLTDSFWYATLYKTFEAKYSNDSAPALEKQAAYYNDTRQIDLALYEALPYRNEIWELLKSGRGETLCNLVSAWEVEAERERTFYWYDGAKAVYTTPVKYITLEDELYFIHKASQFIFHLCFTGGTN